VRLKTEAELIAEAKENLIYWKAHKKSKTSLVDFLIQAEIIREPEELQATRFENLNIFKKNVGDEMAKLGEAKDLFQKMREQILAKYIKIYCRDNALYTDFVENGCGNCEAQSKFVIAHLQEAKLSPPPG
jgi:hypothetical protein